MIISISIVAQIFLYLLAWGFLYLFTVLSRFGDDLTFKSETLAIIISGIPVLIFLLWQFKLIIFTL